MHQNTLQTGARWLCTASALSMILYHFYYIVRLPYEPSVNAIVHLGFAFVVLLSNFLSKKINPLHLLFLMISLYATYYFFANYDLILEDPSYPPMGALVAGILASIITFYLAYKAFGVVFPIVTLVGILYMWLGSSLPSGLRAPSIDWHRMITLLAADVTSPWGLYGSLLILSANYLFLFIIFGAFLDAFGGLRFVMNLGSWAASFFRSGAAALSVITSAMLGSVTGSTVANITITGAFSIPLMKKTKYTAEQAAAIETAASSGGQILPPVMGATVFIMSGFTGIPYLTIVKSSIAAALIYFAILLIYAELNARRSDILPLPREKIDIRAMLWSAPVFIAPLGLLLYLLFLGLSLMKTIFFCILATLALGLICNFFQRERLVWKEVLAKTVQGVISGSQIAVVLALIGVAVACVEVTGLGMRLGGLLVTFSLNNLHILLFLTALTALVLGIGLPTPAAYIICATILSPALTKMGVPLLQAHLFPLYFALFSHLTPPVGIGLMVACKLADANYMKAAVEAMKAAFPSFILPFLFIYSPGLLLHGSAMTNMLAIFGTIVFFIAMSVLTNRYFASSLSKSNMVVLIAALVTTGIYMIGLHNPLLLIAGAALLGLALFMNINDHKRLALNSVKETI